MNSIKYSDNKILKLQNILKYRLELGGKDLNFESEVEKMQAYIKVKGANQIGPLIQHIVPYINSEGGIEVSIQLFLQCDRAIDNVSKPYTFDELIRVCGCMYCRYTGEQENLKHAYEKINVEAFEKGERLTGESYTVYVSHDGQEGIITADVFMTRKNAPR